MYNAKMDVNVESFWSGRGRLRGWKPGLSASVWWFYDMTKHYSAVLLRREVLKLDAYSSEAKGLQVTLYLGQSGGLIHSTVSPEISHDISLLVKHTHTQTIF